MPRRANLAAAIQDLPASQQDSQAENLAILRTQWRWAAFSQFFFTFFPLFALNDVSVADIEQDLVSNTRQVLPRIMQKLLYALSYDRKVSVDNWQVALRKQYNKRTPQMNPIGPELLPSTSLRKDDTEQDTEKGTSDGTDDKDDPPNVSERGISITVASFGDFTSLQSTPLNELDSTRQSSVVEERRAPRTSNDIDHPQQNLIDWFDLPMIAKLESMHTVAEWQFQNPTKLRTIMKSDDEFASWRVEPIGYDRKGNSYWLIGADRLWIQRAQPKAPKPMVLKRKRPLQRTFEKKELSAQNAKRLRINSPEKLSTHLTPSTPPSNRHSRAAKDQAKKRLGVQAKELADLNRQAALTNSGTRRQGSLRSSTTPLVMGTRSSARLRGTQDDEWQSIPEEWLKGVNQTSSSIRLEAKTGLETDEESVSELTELSEDSSEPPSMSLIRELSGRNDEASEDDEDDYPAEPPPEDFVEWETICASLQEWEHIAERFERASHYSEKALYKVLVNDIVPVIIHELREIGRKRHLEEAIVHRKRSSRIALRESEKEEAQMSSMKKQEEEEKMSRSRRLEARKQREEEERIKREHAREQRRQEREVKEETRKAQLEDEEAKALNVAERAAKKRKTLWPSHNTRKTNAQKTNRIDTSSGSRTPAGEDWELACEICNQQGVNLDDGTPMMSCGICSRWQHIQCHDRADRMTGRPRRNWNSEEFTCSRCRATQRVQYNNQYLPTSKQSPSQNSNQVPPFKTYTPPQLNMASSSGSIHQDSRSPSHHLSGYNNPSLQNQYGRPNGQQYPNAQYPSSLGHSILSFSHYQPSQHAFLASAPNKTLHPNAQSLYTNTNNSNTFQQHLLDYVVPQTPSWNTNAAPPSGNSTSSYTPDNHDLQPVHTYSNHEPQTSYPRYSTDNHSAGYKKPVPYPTPSRP